MEMLVIPTHSLSKQHAISQALDLARDKIFLEQAMGSTRPSPDVRSVCYEVSDFAKPKGKHSASSSLFVRLIDASFRSWKLFLTLRLGFK